MRIHSDVLGSDDLQAALAEIPYGGVYLQCRPTRHGSRSRDHAYEAKLRGYGARHTRRPNSGTYGADDEYAATYDDWGYWLAELFSRDPNAICGPYKGAADFQRQTAARSREVERGLAVRVGEPCYPVTPRA
jgi:hypothetical protein